MRQPKVKVLVVGNTPPPYGGGHIMIKRFVETDLADVELIHVRMGFSSHMNELGRVSFLKIAHLFGLIARIVYRRLATGARVLYFPPAGPSRVPVVRDIAVLLATRWLFDKTVFHYHNSGIGAFYQELPAWQKFFFRRAYFGADGAIRLSELTPDDARQLEARREFVIPNGIDDPAIGFDLERDPAGGTTRPLRILFVGILCEAKGVMVLIEACGKLAARGVPFELNLMGQWGSDEFASRIQQRIGELNLSDKVRFLGLLTGAEKLQAFAAADVCCHPSFYDTFPVVLLEAMAFALPVVSTRFSGIPAIVDDGVTGLLVAPHDSTAVAARLELLAGDASLRERLGKAGRVKFEREYTYAMHVDRMRQALLETAGVAEYGEQPATSQAVAV